MPTDSVVGGTLSDHGHVVHHLEHVMGTVVTIDIYTEDGLTADPRSLLRPGPGACHPPACRRVFSTWKADSPISRLRRGEITVDEAPPEVAEVLELLRHGAPRSPVDGSTRGRCRAASTRRDT